MTASEVTAHWGEANCISSRVNKSLGNSREALAQGSITFVETAVEPNSVLGIVRNEIHGYRGATSRQERFKELSTLTN